MAESFPLPKSTPIQRAFAGVVDAHTSALNASNEDHAKEGKEYFLKVPGYLDQCMEAFKAMGPSLVEARWNHAVQEALEDADNEIALIPHKPWLSDNDFVTLAKEFLEQHGHGLNQVALDLYRLSRILPDSADANATDSPTAAASSDANKTEGSEEARTNNGTAKKKRGPKATTTTVEIAFIERWYELRDDPKYRRRYKRFLENQPEDLIRPRSITGPTDFGKVYKRVMGHLGRAVNYKDPAAD